jgi:hypothetical protein
MGAVVRAIVPPVSDWVAGWYRPYMADGATGEGGEAGRMDSRGRRRVWKRRRQSRHGRRERSFDGQHINMDSPAVERYRHDFDHERRRRHCQGLQA